MQVDSLNSLMILHDNVMMRCLDVIDDSLLKKNTTITGWITPWNVQCGIAEYVRQILNGISQKETLVFAAKQPIITRRRNESNVLRNWKIGKYKNGLDAVLKDALQRKVNTLVIQFNYGFFNHLELSSFIESATGKGISVIVELHSTIDPFGENMENFRLSELAASFKKCRRVFVHSISDVTRMKSLGLESNVVIFPLGVKDNGYTFSLPAKLSVPIKIATFGFCLPNKGFIELVEAVNLLKINGNQVRLVMLAAQHAAPSSSIEIDRIRQAIVQFQLEKDIEFITEYLDEDSVLSMLLEADLLVNPYQDSGESASASIRFALASGRPVAVTPISIFDDLGKAVFRFKSTSPHDIAQGIISSLAALKEASPAAIEVQTEARKWVEAHSFSKISENIYSILAS
jgi:O-antigen biosynthesis alpha-1,2-mannosyltransferase